MPWMLRWVQLLVLLILQMDVSCCGRFVLPISWKWWVAPLSIFKLIEGGVGMTSFCNNGSLIYLTVFYLNLPCSLWFIWCGILKVRCIIPSDFGKLHFICGLISDVCNICCCGKHMIWFHETSIKWGVYHSHRAIVQPMGVYCCFCHLVMEFYLETFPGTFDKCFP